MHNLYYVFRRRRVMNALKKLRAKLRNHIWLSVLDKE